jgi:PIN domain nuclease of toxin-antitoxin system
LRLLLDTVAFIQLGEYTLPNSSKLLKIIANGDSELYISQISLLELVGLARKKRKGLPDLKQTKEYVKRVCDAFNIEILPLEDEVIYETLSLAFHHTDPFDRYLIATAIRKELIIVSPDRLFPLYEDAGLKMLW